MLDRFDPFDEGIGNVPGIAKLRVASVEYIPKGSSASCSNPDDYYSYTVALETVWWFGIKTPTKTDSICRMFGQ